MACHAAATALRGSNGSLGYSGLTQETAFAALHNHRLIDARTLRRLIVSAGLAESCTTIRLITAGFMNDACRNSHLNPGYRGQRRISQHALFGCELHLI